MRLRQAAVAALGGVRCTLEDRAQIDHLATQCWLEYGDMPMGLRNLQLCLYWRLKSCSEEAATEFARAACDVISGDARSLIAA
jgi:hypothetical protein